ncbi:hypothetical protein OEA41_007596 [Lepraria neglecta]|uniref:Nuclear localization protein n=1 Tax=Lepraria neglecta TaxID=209136 RepID=A0AAD9ZE57_9LECA|nr:hypothetical protein OEA41_007596 [Lepraria neglecta]
MYSAPPLPATSSMNGMGAALIDGSGTINPAALNTPVTVLPTSSSINAQINPRGQKRSRSSDNGGDPFAEDDDQKPKKRGRPPKTKESPTSTTQQATQNNPDQLRTPQLQAQGLPLDAIGSPTQTSPPKPTPTKSAVVKALPTVRDHTTDQLTLEQDEYLPREYDDRGETKVSPTGEPLGGRQFKMRTFYVAHRGDKRFMLATECARVLGYRDSYLLFNKNRSLHKIIATQAEKDELIHQEILPYSYRSRQIAIVTAKSMFRQFGARVIEGGRRVRDDYWEAKAIKQGFTEEDMAGDKRPGATKAREATVALEANNNPVNSIGFGQHQDIIYANATMDTPDHPHPEGPGYAVNAVKVEDSRQQAYGNIPRPRQEITGAPYIDRTQTSPPSDIMHQAQNAADLNKHLAQQRVPRAKYVEDVWNKDHKTPVSTPQQKVDQSPIVTQSPRLPSSAMMNTNQQSMLQHQASQMMSPQAAYSRQQQPHHQNPHAQSPGRGSMPSTIRPDLQHQQRPSVSYPAGQHAPQTSPYGYPHPNQMWGHPPPQPQQSPLSSHHPQYSPSPHPQQQHHPSQSPHPQHPQQAPQLHHSQSSGSMHNLNYQAMAGMPAPAPGYSAAAGMAGIRAMYPPQSGSPSHAQQQYMQQQATTAAQQAGMQGWAPPPQQQQQPGAGWQQQGGYPTSSGY